MPLASLAAVVAIVLEPTGRDGRHHERDRVEPAPSRSDDGGPDEADLRVLVIVPTYQEADNIEPLLRRLRAACPRADVLVVDDSSPDGTAAKAEQLGAELGGIDVLRRSARGGLASAYADGFDIAATAGYDVAVEMDADRSHEPEQLFRLLNAVDLGADVAIGSRYVKGGHVVGWSTARRLLSRAGGGYARLMLQLPVHDTTSGFRAYRTSVLRSIDRTTLRSHGYGFQVEMTFRAVRAGAHVVEVPITFHERMAGRSKMSPVIVLDAFTMVTTLAMTHRDRAVVAHERVDH
jgi:glycosyltransferase involved in cell wall biosynthesis